MDNIALNTWFWLQKLSPQWHVSEDNLRSFRDFLGSNLPQSGCFKVHFHANHLLKKGNVNCLWNSVIFFREKYKNKDAI